VLQSLGHGERRGSGELGGVLLSVTPAEDLSNGLEAVLLDSLLRGKYESSSAIGEGRGVGSGDGSVSRLEGRLQCAGLGLVELRVMGKKSADW
jgi:hypothetical protein